MTGPTPAADNLDPLDVMDTADQDGSEAELARARRRRHSSRRPALQRMRHRSTPAAVNVYPHVLSWVTDWLAPTYAHEVSSAWRWCEQWWMHAEALVRLEAAWRAWEALRLDPSTGPSVWLAQHGDPCIQALTEPDGPFAQCKEGKHRPSPMLPTAPPPPGLFLNP